MERLVQALATPGVEFHILKSLERNANGQTLAISTLSKIIADLGMYREELGVHGGIPAKSSRQKERFDYLRVDRIELSPQDLPPFQCPEYSKEKRPMPTQ